MGLLGLSGSSRDRFKFLTGKVHDQHLRPLGFPGGQPPVGVAFRVGFETWEKCRAWNGCPRGAEAMTRGFMLRFFGGKPRPSRLSRMRFLSRRVTTCTALIGSARQRPMRMSTRRASALEGNHASSRALHCGQSWGENLTGQQRLPGPLPPDQLYAYHGTELKPEAPVHILSRLSQSFPRGTISTRGRTAIRARNAGSDSVSPATGLGFWCTARCDADDQCDCVTFAPEGGKCWSARLASRLLTTRARPRRLQDARRVYTLAERERLALRAVEIDTNPAPV